MWRRQYRTADNFSRHFVTRPTRPFSKTFPPLSGVRAENRIWLASLRRDAHFLIGNKSGALPVAWSFFSLQKKETLNYYLYVLLINSPTFVGGEGHMSS